jgi:hypothetical protein
MTIMHRFGIFIILAALAFSSVALLASSVSAQTTPDAGATNARKQQAIPATQQAKPVTQQVQSVDEFNKKCLRALNGACTNPVVVELARQRGMIMPAVRVSYFGTPAGTVGGRYIPFERFFQDNPQVFGLPTVTLVNPACCVTRSK